MKIRNKIIALMISIIAMPTFALAKDGAYVGAKVSKITVKYAGFEGFSGDKLLPGDFKALDLYAGYNVGNGFFEIAYLNSDKDTKTGSQTVGDVTLTGTNVGIEFDGYRIGTGYNFNLQNNITIKPFINYYDLKFKGSGTLTASAGTNRITTEASGSDRDQGIDAGLGLEYIINNQSKIGISYSQFIDKFEDTDSTKVYSINYNYQF